MHPAGGRVRAVAPEAFACSAFPARAGDASFKRGCLIPEDMLVQVDGREFSPSNLDKGMVPVFFTATWCGFCHRILPTFKRESVNAPDTPFVVVDVSDEDAPVWDDLNLEYVPTIMFFENGRPGKRIHGILKDSDVAAFIAAGGN